MPVNENRVFQRQLAREQGLTMNEAGNLIAGRAKKVAELAGCHWGGQDKRGVMFFDTFSTGPNEIAAPTVFFSFETVIDEPSRVIAWGREMHARYEPIEPTPTIQEQSATCVKCERSFKYAADAETNTRTLCNWCAPVTEPATCGFQAWGFMPPCVLDPGHAGDHSDGFSGFYGNTEDEAFLLTPPDAPAPEARTERKPPEPIKAKQVDLFEPQLF